VVKNGIATLSIFHSRITVTFQLARYAPALDHYSHKSTCSTLPVNCGRPVRRGGLGEVDCGHAFSSSRSKNFLYPSLYMITKRLWKSQMLSHPNSEWKIGIFSSWLFCYLSIQPSVTTAFFPYGIVVLQNCFIRILA
jgi:hypothetical protein